MHDTSPVLGRTIYKVMVDDADHYCEFYESAKTIYTLGEECGCTCRLYLQNWFVGSDEPDEYCLESTEDKG